MKRLIAIACLALGSVVVRAEDPTDPPPRPRFRPEVDDPLAGEVAPEKLPLTRIEPVEERVKSPKLDPLPDPLPDLPPIGRVDPLPKRSVETSPNRFVAGEIPDRVQVPKVDSLPALPD